MRTPDQCLAKAEDLEREARASKSEVRRQAFLDLAEHWRRLAQSHAQLHARRQAETDPAPWPPRTARVN
ncbi:MAG: hypothetical protein K1X35_14050 [Caulobacteraceae bacterium]|nr:hypothetical protein [Caulobacteraceae bacterium]